MYYDKKLTEYKTNIKETWKILNNIINRKSRRSLLSTNFNMNGREISNPLDIANDFWEYCSNIGPSLAKTIPTSARGGSRIFCTLVKIVFAIQQGGITYFFSGGGWCYLRLIKD